MDGNFQQNHHMMGYDAGGQHDMGMDMGHPGEQGASMPEMDHFHAEPHPSMMGQHQQFNSYDHPPHPHQMELDYNQHHHHHPHQGLMTQTQDGGHAYLNGVHQPSSSASETPMDKNVLLVIHSFLKKHKLEVKYGYEKF